MQNSKKILLILITQIFVYIVLFLGFSFLWKKLNFNNNIAFTVVIGISILIYTFVYYKLNFKFRNWLLGILPMWFLSSIYHPHDLFGISDGGTLDWTSASFDALVFSILLLIVQYIIYFIIKKIKHIKR